MGSWKIIEISFPLIFSKSIKLNESIGFPSKFIEQLLRNKLITVKSASSVIRLYPPLIIKKEDITTGIEILEKTCNEYKN